MNNIGSYKAKGLARAASEAVAEVKPAPVYKGTLAEHLISKMGGIKGDELLELDEDDCAALIKHCSKLRKEVRKLSRRIEVAREQRNAAMRETADVQSKLDLVEEFLDDAVEENAMREEVLGRLTLACIRLKDTRNRLLFCATAIGSLPGGVSDGGSGKETDASSIVLADMIAGDGRAA